MPGGPPTQGALGCTSRHLVRKGRQFPREQVPPCPCACSQVGSSESLQTGTCQQMERAVAEGEAFGASPEATSHSRVDKYSAIRALYRRKNTLEQTLKGEGRKLGMLVAIATSFLCSDKSIFEKVIHRYQNLNGIHLIHLDLGIFYHTHTKMKKKRGEWRKEITHSDIQTQKYLSTFTHIHI